MPLIVEDGTGKQDSESYCSVADADTYFASRGVTDWSNMTVPDKEIALRKATDYIELRFGSRFLGARNNPAQSLSFPRDANGIPRNLIRACAEYALRAKAAPLVADPVVDGSGLAVSSKTEKLGPMQETTQYATTTADLFKPYPAADMLLKSLLRPSGIVR